MDTHSRADRTLFFCYLVLFLLLAAACALLFRNEDYFYKVGKGFMNYILKGLVYIILCIVLPLWLLSSMLVRYTISKGQIKVIDWLGLRRRTFTLPPAKELKLGQKTAAIYFRFHKRDSKYVVFNVLTIPTQEGRLLHIQSRYYENFNELYIAIRKACG